MAARQSDRPLLNGFWRTATGGRRGRKAEPPAPRRRKLKRQVLGQCLICDARRVLQALNFAWQLISHASVHTAPLVRRALWVSVLLFITPDLEQTVLIFMRLVYDGRDCTAVKILITWVHARVFIDLPVPEFIIMIYTSSARLDLLLASGVFCNSLALPHGGLLRIKKTVRQGSDFQRVYFAENIFEYQNLLNLRAWEMVNKKLQLAISIMLRCLSGRPISL